MLFRPDFFLDQVSEKYSSANGSAAVRLIASAETGEAIRVIIESPDFDTGAIQPTMIIIPASEQNADANFSAQGLNILPQDDKLTMDELFPGTPFFEVIGNEYDFCGDSLVQIIQVQIKNDSMLKELFFIPLLIILMGIFLVQRRCATQPAF